MMQELIKQLTRIADALEAQAKRLDNNLSGEKYKERHRKRLRLLLAAETDKRFPDLADQIKSEKFREIPLDEMVIEFLSDECGDPTAVLNHISSNLKFAKVLATMDSEDARRELQNIDLRLAAKEAGAANDLLSAALGKKGTP